jgi:uncharacterized membrane protein
LIGSLIDSHAQRPQDPTFQLAFCNISTSTNVLVALSYKQEGERWLVNGWYAIPDNGCALLGSFPRDTIYYYAEGNKGVWRATDTDQTAAIQCVDRAKWFQATASVPSCPAGQDAVRFRMIKVAPNKARLTWTLSGGK